jgi:hypothetical protein
MKLVFLSTFLFAACLPSCATILSDSDYPVTLATNPPGGTVTVTNEGGQQVFRGPTPTTIVFPASSGFFNGETYQVDGELAGHAPVSSIMDSSIDGWYIGNLLFGGILGLLLIDPATGSMWMLEDTFTLQFGTAQGNSAP